MKFKDLTNLYEKKKNEFGKDTPKYISEIFTEAKEIHHNDWLKSPTLGKDHEQSWRAFKGKNLEKLIIYIIKDQVKDIGLKIINGNILERTNSSNLTEELDRVKRNLLVDFGKF